MNDMIQINMKSTTLRPRKLNLILLALALVTAIPAMADVR